MRKVLYWCDILGWTELWIRPSSIVEVKRYSEQRSRIITVHGTSYIIRMNEEDTLKLANDEA